MRVEGVGLDTFTGTDNRGSTVTPTMFSSKHVGSERGYLFPFVTSSPFLFTKDIFLVQGKNIFQITLNHSDWHS